MSVRYITKVKSLIFSALRLLRNYLQLSRFHSLVLGYLGPQSRKYVCHHYATSTRGYYATFSTLFNYYYGVVRPLLRSYPLLPLAFNTYYGQFLSSAY